MYIVNDIPGQINQDNWEGRWWARGGGGAQCDNLVGEINRFLKSPFFFAGNDLL